MGCKGIRRFRKINRSLLMEVVDEEYVKFFLRRQRIMVASFQSISLGNIYWEAAWKPLSVERTDVTTTILHMSTESGTLVNLLD